MSVNFFHDAETKYFLAAKNFIRGKFEDPRLELFVLLLLLIYLMLTKCKNLLRKIYIKIAIPICGMLIKVNNQKTL